MVIVVGSTANPGAGTASELFALNRDGLHWSRALLMLAVALVPLVVLWPSGQEQYFLAATFGALFTAFVDPGGAYGYRASHLVVFAWPGRS